MLLRRVFLFPFAMLYGAALLVRHFLFDRGIAKSGRVSLPTIVIGNVALGGTGKTPHVELALRTLIDAGPLGTLSRGYGRTGSDFHEVHREDDASVAGDEPLMLKRKFSGVRVFVGADRVAGMEAIQREAPEVKVVILDDALQHRALKGGLNIVLTTWQNPWFRDALFPAGSLRDLPGRAREADAVVVTKCPALPRPEERSRWRERLGLHHDQQLFFSGLRYADPRSLHDSTAIVPTGADKSALLFTGIADATALVEHTRSLFGTVRHVAFADHHVLTASEETRLAGLFSTFAAAGKIMITTEKDAARLGPALISGPLEDLPIAVIGVQAVILDKPNEFAALLRSHVATHQAHR